MTATVHVVVAIVYLLVSVHCSSICKESLGLDGCALLPPDDRCGNARPSPRVVGGHDAKLGQFPWMALLYSSTSTALRQWPEHLLPGDIFTKSRLPIGQFMKRFYKYATCGATIISDTFVVTAAHCCQQGELKIVSVRLGVHDMDSLEDCEAGTCAPSPQEIAVDDYVIHENYDPLLITHDICLLHLRRRITFNDFVAPICLPTSHNLQNRNFEGTNLEVAGWGIMKFELFKGVRAKVLQTTSLPVVPTDECQKALGVQVMTSPKLCAGGGGNKDSCRGDSGGPLMGRLADATNSSQKYYLLGVVSYGDDKCTGEIPGAYVDVRKYLEWILNHMVLLEQS